MAWRYGSDQVGGVSDPTFSSLFSVHQGEWGFGELCVAISISYGVSGCVAWVSTEPSIDANISSLSNLFFTSVHDDRSPGDTVASDRDDGMDLGSISGCGTRVARKPIYVWMRRAMIGSFGSSTRLDVPSCFANFHPSFVLQPLFNNGKTPWPPCTSQNSDTHPRQAASRQQQNSAKSPDHPHTPKEQRSIIPPKTS